MRKQVVYCPKCAAEIYKYDGYSTTQGVVRCPVCKRTFRYYPLGDKTVEVEKPQIKSSSGARFW